MGITVDPEGIEAYFTNVDALRATFKTLVSESPLSKRIIAIHGVGGIGKSSLVRMFRLHCKRLEIPVALASGDDAKSVLTILSDWAEDLAANNVKLPVLSKTLKHYRAIQSKVEDKTQELRKKMGDQASSAASKAGETAVGAALGSLIPGIGTVAGALGGMGAAALVDWLRSHNFAKADIDLLLDPAQKMTDDFLADLAQVANKRRVVLLVDTFEQLPTLSDWVCDLAQRCHPNILLVVAGRAMPDWSRIWPGWLAHAHVEELHPMSDTVMRDLVQRYYATMRGGAPNANQVEAILHFARGLPMVVTSAVQLWVKYGVEDFQSVKTEIAANLVDRLMEGVPPELIPALEAAAVVRWFDQPILRAVTGLADVRDVYSELRRFPFVRTRTEGLALHDVVREMIDENLRVQDSERHCELHESAAGYFEKRLEKATGEEAERLGLERLYHRLCVDEESGIKLFQEMAEELVRYRLINRLRTLVNDIHTYPLKQNKHRLWQSYYDARYSFFQRQFDHAEKLYKEIVDSPDAENTLRANALCSWGDIKKSTRYITKPNGLNELLTIIEKSNFTTVQNFRANFRASVGGALLAIESAQSSPAEATAHPSNSAPG
ncbi:MAG: AAA family ATPase, partial [Herpetosiphonaceae bacterium]|nr:AAA family ATPase [Herpetosiphonaceae bacterium]